MMESYQPSWGTSKMQNVGVEENERLENLPIREIMGQRAMQRYQIKGNREEDHLPNDEGHSGVPYAQRKQKLCDALHAGKAQTVWCIACQERKYCPLGQHRLRRALHLDPDFPWLPN